MKFTQNNYINIQGFMITDLKLSDTELILYALIYGFSQDEESKFSGSLSYMCEATNKCKNSVVKSLNYLIEKGLIIKETIKINNVNFCNYRTNFNKIKEPVGSARYEQGGSETEQGGGSETEHNNKYINNITPIVPLEDKDNNSSLKQQKENIEIPEFIKEDIWKDWVQHRKEKKAPLTNTATKQQIKKLEAWYNEGKDVNIIILDCIERGYRGLYETKSITGGVYVGDIKPANRNNFEDFNNGWR